MKEYILVDGNNIACRAAFANEYMANSNGILSGAHYGFFSILVSLKKKFPVSQFVVFWDSGSKRRKEESLKAKGTGVINETYKENRKRGVKPPPLQTWFDTGHHLKNALSKTGIPQVMINGYEADDVIGSYCELLKKDNKVVTITSDHDYYQLLDDNVVMWDGMKSEYMTKSSFEEEHGITTKQHVDVGAFMGDKSDNIFGVPGWGLKTALKRIKKQGTWEQVIKGIEDKYVSDEQYHEISDEDFQYLAKKKTENKNLIYPGIYKGQPHIGLLKLFDDREVKISKQDVMALIFKDRVKLAYSLKKMDLYISDLPEIVKTDKDKGKLLEYFEYYDILSLVNRIEVFY